MKYNLVLLDISTFRGISIGAEHYYGKFSVYPKFREIVKSDGSISHQSSTSDPRHKYDRYEIKRKLSQKEAIELNKKDDGGFFTSSFGFKKGDETTRFDNKDQLMLAALRKFRELFDPEDILVIKNDKKHPAKNYYMEYYTAWVGPADLCNALNAASELGSFRQKEILPKKYLIFDIGE